MNAPFDQGGPGVQYILAAASSAMPCGEGTPLIRVWWAGLSRLARRTVLASRSVQWILPARAPTDPYRHDGRNHQPDDDLSNAAPHCGALSPQWDMPGFPRSAGM